MIDLAQQFAFLASMFRLPQSEKLCLSTCYLEVKSPDQLRYRLAEMIPTSVEHECCWHALRLGSVVASSFPIRGRNDEIGIEMPFELMLELTCVSYTTEFEGLSFLKGYSTMLVPQKTSENSTQWHLIQMNEYRLKGSEIFRKSRTSNFLIFPLYEVVLGCFWATAER